MQAVRRDLQRIGPIGALVAIVAGVSLWLFLATTRRPDWAPDWSWWLLMALALLVVILGAWALYVCLRLHEPQEVPGAVPSQITDAERDRSRLSPEPLRTPGNFLVRHLARQREDRLIRAAETLASMPRPAPVPPQQSPDVRDAQIRVELAQAELEAFDRKWAGLTFRSKDHDRRQLVSELEDAKLNLAYVSRGRIRGEKKVQPPSPRIAWRPDAQHRAVDILIRNDDADGIYRADLVAVEHSDGLARLPFHLKWAGQDAAEQHLNHGQIGRLELIRIDAGAAAMAAFGHDVDAVFVVPGPNGTHGSILPAADLAYDARLQTPYELQLTIHVFRDEPNPASDAGQVLVAFDLRDGGTMARLVSKPEAAPWD